MNSTFDIRRSSFDIFSFLPRALRAFSVHLFCPSPLTPGHWPYFVFILAQYPSSTALAFPSSSHQKESAQ